MSAVSEGTSNGKGSDNESGGGQKQNPTEQPHWIAYVEGCCDVLLVLITGTYTYYAAGQLHKMKRATEAATSAAQTASDTLKFTRDSFKDDQRAWLGVAEFHTIDFSAARGLIVDISFFNSGKTPARDVYQATGYIAWPTPVSGPSEDQIKSLQFAKVQAVSPQGRIFYSFGN
jgi:hypothetical protein